MILQVLSSTQISATGWFLLSVVPAEVCVFTQAEVFEVVPLGPHLHPRDDDKMVMLMVFMVAVVVVMIEVGNMPMMVVV